MSSCKAEVLPQNSDASGEAGRRSRKPVKQSRVLGPGWFQYDLMPEEGTSRDGHTVG